MLFESYERAADFPESNMVNLRIWKLDKKFDFIVAEYCLISVINLIISGSQLVSRRLHNIVLACIPLGPDVGFSLYQYGTHCSRLS
ncbi:hypothetical protein GL2_33810 [Microbulbifer sp. GL-2]|nr:hypothetical protein GL2_33810 [Microbulbifer sp. GL-2]